MPNYNKVIFIGHLGRDPETRYSQSGAGVTSFSLAVSKRWKDKIGEKQEKTLWLDVSCFGNTADFVQQYMVKGQAVLVEGELEERSWETDGQKRSKMQVNAYKVQSLGRAASPDNSDHVEAGQPYNDAPF